MKHIFIVVVLVSLLSSCGASKHKSKSTSHKHRTERTSTASKPAQTKQNNNTPAETQVPVVSKPVTSVEEYIQLYAGIAVEEMKFYHIPASITLAQGILESGSGRGRLAVEANNHFGIKCHEWTGDRIYHDDDKNQECFRKYKDPKYSFRDHSLFLTERKRYAQLFELDIDDYRGWARGLRAAGYATDRKYPEKLIALIERYQLYRYDGDYSGKTNTVVVKTDANNIHFVKKGDTLYSISKKYNISIQELQRINGLNDTTISIGQELYVKSM
ncbi:glucosaminidase domain-containing protein [Formosa sp. A9]|uniref:glucosaminidase domain-containing protein n=1 Tax=Formosa sp. A9 TaxID=3442641 RepID=UPI003EB82821